MGFSIFQLEILRFVRLFLKTNICFFCIDCCFNPFPAKRSPKIFIFASQNFTCGVPSFCSRSIFSIFVVQVCKYTLIFYIVHVSSFHFQIRRFSKIIKIGRNFWLCQHQNSFENQKIRRALTHSFFQGGWHFPENPQIDGDADPFLKSGKILNHHGARARMCFLKSNTKQYNSDGIQFLLSKSFFSRK